LLLALAVAVRDGVEAVARVDLELLQVWQLQVLLQ
jgi:hypothetical protein